VVRHRDQPLDDLVARLVRGHVQRGIVLVVRLVEQRRLGGEERVDEVQPGALGYPVPLVAMCSAVWPFLSVRSAMLGSASSSAHHLHSLVLPGQQRPELLGVHAGHHLRMDPSWPARAAACIAVSCRFPVSCFVIFLRRVAACAALGESIANTVTGQRLAKGGTGPWGSAPGLLRRGLLPREKRGEWGCIPCLWDLPNAAEDYPVTDRTAGSRPEQ